MKQENSVESRGCPVIHYDYVSARPAFSFFREVDALRERSPFWNSYGPGFWAVMRYDQIVELTRNADVFIEQTFDPLDPNPEYRFIPNHTEGQEHSVFKTILNRWFSPDAVNRLAPAAREICARRIAALASRGACDFVSDFALGYPTEVFLTAALGIPKEEADAGQFLSWIQIWFDGFASADKSLTVKGVSAVHGYFSAALALRRKRPRNPEIDFVTYLMLSEIDGRSLDDKEILDICMTVTTAGLDTTRASLGYLFHHLACHPEDRTAILAGRVSIPSLVEESLRLYSIIISDARVLTKDFDFHGAHMKKGDVVWFSPSAANRDPTVYPDPNRFMPDRRGKGHLGFGAGHHRCVGSHLARKELAIAVEEWHRVIPHYQLVDTGPTFERGVMCTLLRLALSWKV
jgi:cytochrome P450